MTDYKLYPNLPPSAPPENPQVVYHLSVIQAKQKGLKNKEQMFKQKNEKYNKILNRLTWLNACSSGISVATGISSVATFATFVGLPVSMAFGAASMTGAIAGGIISMLPKKYQKKLKKVTRLIDIVLPEDGLHRYLLQPGEENDDQRHRATDRIWSKGTFRLREIMENPGNRVVYYLLNGPERAFVSEELMLIPEDTVLPPDYVQEW